MANSLTSKDLAIAVYVLQILGLFTGGFFLVALVVNYLKRDSVRGSFVDSHFGWQIATFWWGLVGLVVSGMTMWIFGLGILIYAIVWLWVLYRIVWGLRALVGGKPV